VGLVDKLGDVVTATFKREGETILLLGPVGKGLLGGSEYVARHTGAVKGELASIDLDVEAKLQKLALELARGGLVSSMHDVSDGGLATAIVECCVATDQPSAMIGADVSLPSGPADAVAALFSEEPSRIVASLPTTGVAEVVRRAGRAGVPVVEIGTTTAMDVILRRNGSELVRATLAGLRDARETCLSTIVGE
jgi:phosphoribosylformylglycinamidine synthase